jgi:hypothetical protein
LKETLQEDSMRRFTLVVALVLTSASSAQAQGGAGMGGGAMGMGMPLDDASFRPTIAMLTTMLHLTPEQALKATPLRDSMLINTKASRAEALTARTAMQQARRAGVGSDSLTVLRQKMQTIMMGMMPARMQFHGQLRALLTEDQARILDTHQQEMLGSMGQRMQGASPAGP